MLSSLKHYIRLSKWYMAEYSQPSPAQPLSSCAFVLSYDMLKGIKERRNRLNTDMLFAQCNDDIFSHLLSAVAPVSDRLNCPQVGLSVQIALTFSASLFNCRFPAFCQAAGSVNCTGLSVSSTCELSAQRLFSLPKGHHLPWLWRCASAQFSYDIKRDWSESMITRRDTLTRSSNEAVSRVI